MSKILLLLGLTSFHLARTNNSLGISQEEVYTQAGVSTNGSILFTDVVPQIFANEHHCRPLG